MSYKSKQILYFFQVNEEGTEAAAATGLMAVARMLGPMPVQGYTDSFYKYILNIAFFVFM